MRNLIIYCLVFFSVVVNAQVLSQGQLNYQPPANLIQNSGFERGLTKWTSSGGTVAIVTSGSNLLFDKASLTFDASSTGQYVQSALYTIPEGLKGTSCEAILFYKGGDTNLTLKVLDNTPSVLASQALAAATYTTKLSLTFTCPTSGSIQLKLESTANAAIISIDNGNLGGLQNTATLSTAAFVGSVNYTHAASCTWVATGTSDPANAAADTDCNTPTASGSVSIPTTKIPAVRLQNLPAGVYVFKAKGTLRQVSGDRAYMRFSDGTNNTSVQACGNAGAATDNYCTHIEGVLTFNSAITDTTVNLQIAGGASAANATIDLSGTEANNSQQFQIDVFRYPLP